MIGNIDINKSISIDRVCFNRSILDLSIRYFCIIFFTLILPISSLSYTFNHPELLKDDILGHIIINVLILGASSILFIAVTNSNKMTRVNTKNDSEKNRIIVIKIIHELGWIIYRQEKDCIIAQPNSWNKQITILFDYRDILISSVRFGKSDIMEFNNQDNLDKILDQINKHIQN